MSSGSDGGPGDGLEMLDETSFGRLVVVGRHDQDRVHAAALGDPRELDAVARVVGARAGDDRRPAGDRLEDGAEHRGLLVVGECRRLAGRAGDDEAVRAVGQQVEGELAERLVIDIERRRERRHHRGDDRAEPWISHDRRFSRPTTVSLSVVT